MNQTVGPTLIDAHENAGPKITSTGSESVLIEVPLAKGPESSDDKEQRLQRDLKINPMSDKIKAVPFEWIGKDIVRSHDIYPSNVPTASRKNFPDWHKITPAYSIKFSGRTMPYLITSLFDPKSNNNIPKRIARWAMEDHAVAYTSRYSKAAALIAFCLLVMTLVMTMRELTGPSQSTFLYGMKWIKLVGSIFSGTMLMWSVFKRTTIPARDVVIKNFANGNVEVAKSEPRHKQTLGTLVGQKK